MASIDWGPLPAPLRQIVDDPSWEYPCPVTGRRSHAQLRVWWASNGGVLAVVTPLDAAAPITTEQVWEVLVARFLEPLVLEHSSSDEGGHCDQEAVKAAGEVRGQAGNVWTNSVNRVHIDERDRPELLRIERDYVARWV